MSRAPTVAYDFERKPIEQMRADATRFAEVLRRRRSVRHFSADEVPIDVVQTCVEAAAQAPSGANKQPWTFCVVTDAKTKRAIREAAEAEERLFYDKRAPQAWLDALHPFGTDADKPFLETAPVLIAVFAHQKAPDDTKNYYVQESVGIAVGFLIAALQCAGLATLTHTPVPMKFLAEILRRPANERAFLLLPVGYPSEGCEVPAIARKSLSEVLVSV